MREQGIDGIPNERFKIFLILIRFIPPVDGKRVYSIAPCCVDESFFQDAKTTGVGKCIAENDQFVIIVIVEAVQEIPDEGDIGEELPDEGDIDEEPIPDEPVPETGDASAAVAVALTAAALVAAAGLAVVLKKAR